MTVYDKDEAVDLTAAQKKKLKVTLEAELKSRERRRIVSKSRQKKGTR